MLPLSIFHKCESENVKIKFKFYVSKKKTGKEEDNDNFFDRQSYDQNRYVGCTSSIANYSNFYHWCDTGLPDVLGTTYQTGEKYTKLPQKYQMSIT
jgi:hypothetical protein